MKQLIFTLLAITSLLISQVNAQTVTIQAATNITQTDVTFHADVNNLNTSNTYKVTFSYGLSSGDYSESSFSSDPIDGVLNFSFSEDYSNLDPSTQYFVKVTLKEKVGTSWNSISSDQEISFTTLANTVPTVTIGASVTGITTSSATVNSNEVTGDGGSTISDRGTCYSSSNSTPNIIDDNVCSNGSGVGTFNCGYNTTLSAGTTYYVRAYATNSTGTGYSSITRNFTTTCAAPTVSAATALSGSGFTANWDATTGAEAYLLDVSTASDFSTYVSGYQNLNVGSVTTYAVTGLSASTTYYYRVSATNDGGDDGANTEGDHSTNQSLTTTLAAPTTQASHLVWQGALGSGKIEFSWVNGNGAGRLMVMRASGNVTNPASGTSYTANSVFGNGSNVGNNTYVVYDGSGAKSTSNTTVTGLSDGVTYYFKVLEYNGSGSSTSYNTDAVDGFDAGNSDDSGLPISLIAFNAVAQDAQVLVSWKTATEINNQFFLVERSLDAENFEVIASLEGAGNSNTELNYSFIDKNCPAAIVYYRLTQVDFNGNKTTFYTVSVNRTSESNELKNVYVNNQTLQVELGLLSNETTKVSLIDVNGKLIEFCLSNPSENQLITFDLSELSRGIYFIKLEQGNTVQSRKFIY